jgi:hypothetical protein
MKYAKKPYFPDHAVYSSTINCRWARVVSVPFPLYVRIYKAVLHIRTPAMGIFWMMMMNGVYMLISLNKTSNAYHVFLIVGYAKNLPAQPQT